MKHSYNCKKSLHLKLLTIRANLIQHETKSFAKHIDLVTHKPSKLKVKLRWG